MKRQAKLLAGLVALGTVGLCVWGFIDWSAPSAQAVEAQVTSQSMNADTPSVEPRSINHAATLRGLNLQASSEPLQVQAGGVKPFERAEFERAKICDRVSVLDRLLQANSADETSYVNSKAALDSLSREDIRQLEDNLIFVKNHKRECSGYAPDKVYESALRLAQKGDATASACFAAGRWGLDEIGDETIDRYVHYAPLLILRGMTGGDWRMVSLMIDVTSGNALGLLPRIGKTDPVANYGYLKLMQRGSDPIEAQAIQKQLTAMEPMIGHDAMKERVRWADQTFANHFRNSGLARSDFQKCLF